MKIFFSLFFEDPYLNNSSYAGVVKFISFIFFPFLKWPKVPTVVLLYFSKLRIFEIYQTTDVFPFVPVTAIVLKGKLLWSLFNNE